MALKLLRLSAFPSGIIKNQVDVLVNQGIIDLQEENSILSIQIDLLGACLKRERKNRIKYQKLLKESNACTQDLEERMKKVCKEVEEQKKVNLRLIDLMKGDHSGVNRAPDPAMVEEEEEICQHCYESDDLRNDMLECKQNNDDRGAEEAAAGGRRTSVHQYREQRVHKWSRAGTRTLDLGTAVTAGVNKQL